MSLTVIKRVRAKYPTPLGSRHAEFLIETARTLGSNAGLLKKSSGTRVKLPDSTNVAQDIICYPNGTIYDILKDGEGEAKPSWSVAKGSPVDVSRYYKVAEIPVEPPVEPPAPEPEPETPSEPPSETPKETPAKPVRWWQAVPWGSIVEGIFSLFRKR